MSNDKPWQFQDKFEPWMIDKALSLFRDGESVTSICCELGIVRDTYYNWAKNPEHPFYNTAKFGEQLSQQFWERSGRNGIFGEIEKFAGSSWQFVMKNRFKESYKADEQNKPVSESILEKLLSTHDLKPKEE